ncbi:DUF1036 domain-containing protein [Flavobacterium sp. RHBU_24]|uniref:DUF1036 domain-containing protein n=1 Tax=Flavobacterium sp. RHBU_24 TaxID=3391185 RepID=UPI0039851ED8
MKHLLVIAAVLLFSESSAQVVFENKGSMKIHVAIAYFKTGSGWLSEGWFTLKPGSRETLYVPPPGSSQNFYYCANVEKSDSWLLGDVSFQINKLHAYLFENADQPYMGNDVNIQSVKFIEKIIDPSRETVITLDPVNLTYHKKRHGKWRFSLDKEGNFAEISTDGEYYREINFDQGEPIGWCRDFYKNGAIKAEYKLLSEKPFVYDGKCTAYRENGTVERETVYRNGIPTEEVVFDESGQRFEKKATYYVTKMPVQNIFLNSTTDDFYKKGHSKSLIPVELPPNTVEWYYEYVVSKDASIATELSKKFDLDAQLARYMAQPAGPNNILLNTLNPPIGNDVADIYLIELEHCENFMKNGHIEYFPAGSRLNYKSGIVQVKDLKMSKPFIGVKNKDINYGINISLQVVAVVSKL